jgi:hypothetical protein
VAVAPPKDKQKRPFIKKRDALFFIWFLGMIAIDSYFYQVHPTTDPNNPDMTTQVFDDVFLAVLFGGIIWYALGNRIRRKLKPSPVAQQPS